MFDLDHWREIYNALAGNKLRTALTAFGVFWGIFMLMIMVGAGTGLQNGVTQDFSDGATNSFYVWSQRTTLPYRGLPAGRSFELENQDIEAIKQHVPEVEVVAPRNQLGGYRGGNNVTHGTRSGAFSVMGDYPEIRVIQSVNIDSGRFLNQLDLEDRRKVAVIGSRVVEVLYEEGEEPVGDSVRINGVYFKVIGTFTTRQSGDDGDESASTIYVPFTTFQQAFNYGNSVGWFAVTSAPDVPASEAEAEVLALLRKRHRVRPDDERGLGHYNTEVEYNKVQGLFTGIRLLIWIVGIGTLTAGVIGVSNIMLVIVRERTNEIGIRRAVGARPLSIMSQIILEAMMLTSLAGYVGLVAGVFLMEFISSMLTKMGASTDVFLNPNVSLESALQALVILVFCGTLAGLIPAHRAIRISPVQALRAD